MIRAEWGDMMVPDKFNMVDMGGIDLIMMQGESVPGLYDKLMAAISNCRYQCLYNWLFDGVLISPTYVQLVDVDGVVFLNEGVSVTSDDVIHIYSVEPGPVEPEIIPLLAEENGVYNVPAGKDGFNPVTVDVPSYTPVINPISITENGTYNAPIGVDGYAPVVVDVVGGGIPYPSIPNEYQKVEYIFFNSGQYINIGGMAENTKVTVISKTERADEMHVVGGGDNNSNIYKDFQIVPIRDQSGNLSRGRFWCRGGDSYAKPISADVVATEVSLPINSSGYFSITPILKIIGEFYSNYNNNEIFIGKYKLSLSNYFYGNVYYVKLASIATENAIKEFVPCYRKVDNVPGFYERVNNVFYTNAGTGTFVVGPDIN